MKAIRVECDTKDTLPFHVIQPFQGELKSISPEDLDKLKKEIMTTGFAFPIYVWKDSGRKKFYCIGGHQRLRAVRELKEQGWKDEMGAHHHVKVPELPVVFVKADSIQKAKRRVLQDVAQYGKITGDGLKAFALESGFDVAEIMDSFRLPDIDVVQFIAGAPAGGAASGSPGAANEPYTKRIESPVYTPKGEKPELAALADTARADALCREIAAAEGLSDEEKTFLELAARRHVVFDYEKIAEYYAHASPGIQRLMENSALVIIDFEKAIEKGFVVLSEKIAESYRTTEAGAGDEDSSEE